MRISLSILLCIILHISVSAQSTQITVTESNGIGINAPIPGNFLHIEVPELYFQDGIFCNINTNGTSDRRAIRGSSLQDPGYGIGGHFTGGFRGIYALGNGGSYDGYYVYGAYHEATGSAGQRVGTFTRATGGDENIGIWASASGGTENIAAKFGNGDIEVEDFIRVNSNNSTGRLTITNSDNIGSYAAALRMYASNNGPETTYGAFVNATNSGSGNSVGFRAITYEPGDLAFWGQGDSYFTGDVRIGQNVDPDGLYKLIVDGKILSEEVRVQNSLDWPDYVFNNDYDLMSLQEVEDYINTHHHLPNIPPAAEVEREGIILGEMQVRLMEKIEELTLHMIAQDKKIEALTNQIKAMSHEK